jgi:hypothetical protein
VLNDVIWLQTVNFCSMSSDGGVTWCTWYSIWRILRCCVKKSNAVKMTVANFNCAYCESSQW